MLRKSEKAPKSPKPKPTPEQIRNEKAIRREATAVYFAIR